MSILSENSVTTQTMSYNIFDLFRDWTVGGASGATGALVSQPAYNWKLDMQKGTKGSLNRRALFGGSGAAMIGEWVTVASQNALYAKSKTMSIPQTIAAPVAGAISAIPLSVCEMLMDFHRQNVMGWQLQSRSLPKTRPPSYWSTTSKIVKQHGARALFRGVRYTCLREAINSMALNIWAEKISKKTQDHFSDHPMVSHLVGGSLSGVMAAICSHPFDTMKVNSQNGIMVGYAHSKCFSAARKRYEELFLGMPKRKAFVKTSAEVFKDLYKGLLPRSITSTLFITGVYLSRPLFESALVKKE